MFETGANLGSVTKYWVFFFKQKTAYEMRISDWSSDVCSSDLMYLPASRRHWRPIAARSILLAMNTFKTRHQVYLPDDLSAKLDALTASPGTSKTQILTDALNAWLERRGAQELDQRFGPRLDRQNRTTERLARTVDALTEMLGLFIRHQLTLVEDQPPFDSDTARLGRTRYDRFMQLVEQRLLRADNGQPQTRRA